MQLRHLVAGGVAALAAAIAIAAPPAPKISNALTWKILRETRKQGYEEGLEAGRAEGGGGEELRSCQRTCDMFDRIASDDRRKAALADKYEDCLRGIEIAKGIGGYALDAALVSCRADLNR